MNVLVTGGAGYIGSHACKVLARNGITPIVADNLSSGHKWAVQWGPLVCCELSDSAAVSKIFKQYDISAVFHFAASACIAESMSSPSSYFSNNFVNTQKLLDVMLENHVEKIIFSSTCAVYGEPAAQVLDEMHSQDPLNPYGASKLMAERLLSWYGRLKGIKWVSLRYFNAAGADMDGEIGEDHVPEFHLIPRLMCAATGGLERLNIFGGDYETKDGTAVRDYVHVSDLADAHLRALNYLQDGGTSTALNLGNDRGYSVKELLTLMETISKRRIPYTIEPRRPGDPAVLVASSLKARSVLGWKPQWSAIENILNSAWVWHHLHGGESFQEVKASVR